MQGLHHAQIGTETARRRLECRLKRRNRVTGVCCSILKVYKAAMLSILSEAGYQEEEVVETRESLVGKKLSDITTQRVIVGVLLMMFGLQLFELETYRIFDYTTLMNGGLHVLVATYVNRTDMEQVSGLGATRSCEICLPCEYSLRDR